MFSSTSVGVLKLTLVEWWVKDKNIQLEKEMGAAISDVFSGNKANLIFSYTNLIVL